MVKITYDLDNIEESSFVEDYFFFKYYYNVLIQEWSSTYKKYCYQFNTSNEWSETKIKYIKIIINHLNSVEFDRFCVIYNKIFYIKDIMLILDECFDYAHILSADFLPKMYKYKLLERF